MNIGFSERERRLAAAVDRKRSEEGAGGDVPPHGGSRGYGGGGLAMHDIGTEMFRWWKI